MGWNQIQKNVNRFHSSCENNHKNRSDSRNKYGFTTTSTLDYCTVNCPTSRQPPRVGHRPSSQQPMVMERYQVHHSIQMNIKKRKMQDNGIQTKRKKGKMHGSGREKAHLLQLKCTLSARVPKFFPIHTNIIHQLCSNLLMIIECFIQDAQWSKQVRNLSCSCIRNLNLHCTSLRLNYTTPGKPWLIYLK